MSTLTLNFLQLLICPFTDKSLFVWLAGLLTCTWLFDRIFSLIRGDYY